MQKDIPDSLSSTVTMLRSAYPTGIPADAYLPLLRLLYEEMSDRNLALVVSELVGKHCAQVLNDIYKAATQVNREGREVHQVRKMLSQHGYEKWLKEE